jgi:hypothetical protein
VKPDEGLIIHLEGSKILFMGMAIHGYRRAACGVRAERWLTTANTDWSGIENVNCKRCMLTKQYKKESSK